MARKLEVILVGDANSLKRALGGASKDVASFGAISKRHFGGAAASAAKFAAVGVGIASVGSAVRKVIGETVSFDKGMRNVNSIAQLSEGSLKGLEKQVLKLSRATGQSPTTLSEGLYDIVSSGFKANAALTILRASSKAATAGLTDTATSTKAVVAVLNAYHRPASDAAAVSDTLFQTVNLGVLSFEQLASTIGDVLPFASSLGVSIGQVGASLATMTKAGISPEESVTRLKNAMVAFIKPSDGMAKAIKATGAASGEALVKSKGFQGALEAVVKTTDGSKAAVAGLFPNIRGLGGALALTGKNAKGAEKDLAGFANTSGATNKALSQQAQSVALQWQKVKATFSTLAIQLGSGLIPSVNRALQSLKPLAGQIGNIFDNPSMGLGEKLGRAFELVAPKLIDAMASAAPRAASAFVNAFTHAGPMGQLFTVAFLAGKMGAFRALGGLAASQFGKAFSGSAGKYLKFAGAVGGALALGGALMSLAGSTKSAEEASQDLADALDQERNAMKRVRDLDLDAAQAKNTVKQSALAVEQAERDLSATRKSSGKTSIATRQAEANLRAIRIQHKRDVRALSDVEGDAAQATREAGTASRETAKAQFEADRATYGFAQAAAMLKARLSALPAKVDIQVNLAIGNALANANSLADGIGRAISAVDTLKSKSKGRSVGAGAGLAFPTEAAIASAQSSRDSLSAAFDTRDQARERAQLIRDRSVTGRRRVSKSYSKGDKARDIRAADAAITEFNRNLSRARKLAKLDIQITGLDKARAFDDAVKSIASSVKDKLGSAVSEFQTQWETTVGKALDTANAAALDTFDVATEAAIANGPAAQALKALQDDAARVASAAEDASNAQSLEDAKRSGDPRQIAAAEAAIVETARQRAIATAQDQAEAERAGIEKQRAIERTALEDQQAAARQARLDADTAAFSASLDAQLQAEIVHLKNREAAYADFAARVNAILTAAGLSEGLTLSPDEEAAISGSAPVGSLSKVKKIPRRRRHHHASGGPLGVGTISRVGELGPEELYYNPAGRLTVRPASQSTDGVGGGGLHFHGPVTIGSTRAAQAMADRLAIRARRG